MHLLKLSVTVALALAAGHAGAATVTLDPHGLGQGLLFPYFTTHNGHSTLLTVQNTTAQGKALKVRVLESKDGFETLTFNLYLPGFAKWSGALTQADGAPDAPASLLPSSPAVGCTTPAMPAGGFELRPYSLDDAQPAANLRTREGYVEVVEMGTLSAELAQLARDPTQANCNVFTQRTVQDGIWSTEPNADIGAPAGRLRGSATVLDVAAGTAFSYAAPAFGGLASAARHTGLAVSEQGIAYIDTRPALTDIVVASDETIDVTVHNPDGVPTTLQYGADEGFYAISALLATTNTTNDYTVYPGVRARTEWVVSFPTRHALHRAFFWPGTPPPGALLAAPFTRDVCESTALVAWNEHGVKLDTATSVDICGAVDVVQFGLDGTPVSAQLALDGDAVIDVPTPIGSARLDFSKVDERTRAFFGDKNGKCVVGLPAWVMAVQSYDNDNAQEGRIATFPVSNVSSGPVEVVDCDTLD
ncbi:hypothetical protein [Chiayiivirga flava]|uniref:IgGFc-binding protein N-terminal domain-containing protein n=1 Tax=Chiayiivirga flava TaxID=659595 RepID=A0A7W8D7B0_9GAMM|nr:hypothetical protein [Chiayiivirga flava]MBB5209239.1 hypothetical protein [Chiayiivirga flava]